MSWDRGVQGSHNREESLQGPFLLFLGCLLQDPRLLDWILDLDDEVRIGLNTFRALMTRAEWDALAAITYRGTPIPTILRPSGRLLSQRDRSRLSEMGA